MNDSNFSLKEQLKGRVQSYFSGLMRACLVGLLVIFQFALLFMLPFVLRGFTVYFYVLVEIAALAVIIGLTNDKRSPSYKVAWFSIVLILPVSGYIMYSLWGKSGKKDKLQKKIRIKINHGKQYLIQDDEVLKEFAQQHPVSGRMSKYMSSEYFPLFENNQIDYYPMGEDVFQQIFDDLEKAQKFILVDFFIVGEGALWDRMHEILAQKIHEGVEVKFIYDDFGSMFRTDKNFAKDLREEGFEVCIFNPVHKYTSKLFMNYRSHQKIIVIDGEIGFTGGFNIADEYANLVERFGVWKDTGVRLIGDAVWGLTVIFLQMWEVCAPGEFIDYYQYQSKKAFAPNHTYCHILSDGPANNPNNPIESVYKQMITYAGEVVYIMTPYLVLEDFMETTLIEAVKRGVDVRIITPYIPDKKNIKALTNYNYGSLLRQGIRIFEYKPGFIHAKVIMNEHCGIVGTVNMDYRSFYLHYENAVWCYDKDFVQDVMQDFKNTLAQCNEITYAEWKNRPVALKIWQQILNVFSTLT